MFVVFVAAVERLAEVYTAVVVGSPFVGEGSRAVEVGSRAVGVGSPVVGVGSSVAGVGNQDMLAVGQDKERCKVEVVQPF